MGYVFIEYFSTTYSANFICTIIKLSQTQYHKISTDFLLCQSMKRIDVISSRISHGSLILELALN